MRKTYLNQLALPEDITVNVTVEDDALVNQEAVDRFVGSIARPDWYKHDSSNRRDTRLYMMERHQPFNVITIGGKLVRAWECECCHNPVLYEGLQVGHIRKWMDELKYAGVLSLEEAKAAYNNLRNLRIECSTCNQGHDFE